jgi:hypothetical protein
LFGYPANASTAPDDGSCAWNAVRNLSDGALLRSSLVAHAYNGTSAYVEPKAAGGHRVAHVGQRAYAYKVGNSQTIESVNHGKTVVLIYAVRSMSGRPTPSVPDAAALTALARTAAARL